MKDSLIDWLCILFIAALAIGLLRYAAYGADVGLTWDLNPPEDQVRRYNVCWSNYSGNTKAFAFSNCTSTTKPPKVITGISHLQKWYFRVNATNETQTSLWSNYVYLNFIRTPSALKFQKVEIR